METVTTQVKKTKKPKQPTQETKPAPAPAPVAVAPVAPVAVAPVAPVAPVATAPEPVPESSPEQSQPEQKEIRLVDIPINDENIALNVMVGFLNVAHKRGVFTIDESAKIWECISKFQSAK